MLAQRIKAIEGYYSLTDAELLAVVNEKNIPKEDDEQYTWAGIALLAGPESAEALRQALEANGLTWAVHQFGGTGMSLNNPLVQDAMKAFRDSGVPGMDSLIQAGVFMASIADEELGRDATLEEVREAQLSIRKEILLKSARDRMQRFAESLASWDGTGTQPTL